MDKITAFTLDRENRLYSIWKEEFKEYNGELGI